MATTKKLLEVKIHTDSDTGIYQIGELDFGVPLSTIDWLGEGDNRIKLADFLRWLATACVTNKAPFYDGPECGVKILVLSI